MDGVGADLDRASSTIASPRDSSRATAPDRCGRPRRPAAPAATRDRRRSRRTAPRIPISRRRAGRGRRSRHGWRSGPCGNGSIGSRGFPGSPGGRTTRRLHSLRRRECYHPVHSREAPSALLRHHPGGARRTHQEHEKHDAERARPRPPASGRRSIQNRTWCRPAGTATPRCATCAMTVGAGTPSIVTRQSGSKARRTKSTPAAGASTSMTTSSRRFSISLTGGFCPATCHARAGAPTPARARRRCPERPPSGADRKPGRRSPRARRSSVAPRRRGSRTRPRAPGRRELDRAARSGRSSGRGRSRAPARAPRVRARGRAGDSRRRALRGDRVGAGPGSS